MSMRDLTTALAEIALAATLNGRAAQEQANKWNECAAVARRALVVAGVKPSIISNEGE